MLEFSPEEATDVLLGANNINSAVKSFIKRDSRDFSTSLRFAKDLKDVAVSGKRERLLGLIKKNIADQNLALVRIAQHAFLPFIHETTNSAIEKYADSFNATYEITGQEISVKNQAEFEKLIKQALSDFDEALEKSACVKGNFMRLVLICTLFDAAVIPAVLPIAQEYYK